MATVNVTTERVIRKRLFARLTPFFVPSEPFRIGVRSWTGCTITIEVDVLAIEYSRIFRQPSPLRRVKFAHSNVGLGGAVVVVAERPHELEGQRGGTGPRLHFAVGKV